LVEKDDSRASQQGKFLGFPKRISTNREEKGLGNSGLS